jgi:hypothetical protein
MSGSDSGFCRFTVAPPERDCSGAHARSLARCLPWALAHQCRMYNGIPRAQTRTVLFGSCRVPRGVSVCPHGLTAFSYRIEYPFEYRTASMTARELISLPADHLSSTDPQRSGPAIVRQSCGSVRPSSSAHGATHGRYLGAKGKHQKLYREDSPYSTDRRRRVCAHGANDRPHNSTCTIHAG